MSAEDTYWMDGREKLSDPKKMSRAEMLTEAEQHSEKMAEELEEWINEVGSNEDSNLRLPIESLRKSLLLLRKVRSEFYMNVQRAG